MAGRDTSRSSAHASQRDSIDFTFYPAQVPRTEKFERKKITLATNAIGGSACKLYVCTIFVRAA